MKLSSVLLALSVSVVSVKANLMMAGMCLTMYVEFVKETCRLDGAVTQSMLNTLTDGVDAGDGTTAHYTSGGGTNGAWQSCADDAGVPADQTHKQKSIAANTAAETAIKDQKGQRATVESEIAAFQAEISGLTIKHSQEEIRYTHEMSEVRKWQNTLKSESEAFDKKTSDLDNILEENNDFLIDLTSLMGTGAGSLDEIMSTSTDGSYNMGFENQIRDALNVLHGDVKQEIVHVENEKARLTSAFNDREGAITGLICNAMDQANNADNADEDGNDPNEFFCAGQDGRTATDTSAKTVMAVTESELATAKAGLQDSFVALADTEEMIRVLQETKKRDQARQEEERGKYQQRIASFVNVYSLCTTMVQQSAASFIQVDMVKSPTPALVAPDLSNVLNPVSLFVQLSAALKQKNNPINHVQKALLATAEETGNKQLAVFATSLTQVAGAAGGALDKVIVLVKDMITALQKQIDKEHVGGWCDSQELQVNEAVSNADSYLLSINAALGTLSADTALLTNAIQNLNGGIFSDTNNLQIKNSEVQGTEVTFAAYVQARKEQLNFVGKMRDELMNSEGDMVTQMLQTLKQTSQGLQKDIDDETASHKTYISAAQSATGSFKKSIARKTADLEFKRDTHARKMAQLEENNAAKQEAEQSKAAATEMKLTFAANCDNQDGLQIANGATALESCATACHTLNALELACHTLADGDAALEDQCLLCPSADTVAKVKSADGVVSYVCSDDAGYSAPLSDCEGQDLAKGQSCKFTSPSGVASKVFHSDVACSRSTNAVAGCELIVTTATYDGCDDATGLEQGGVEIAACRTQIIGQDES